VKLSNERPGVNTHTGARSFSTLGNAGTRNGVNPLKGTKSSQGRSARSVESELRRARGRIAATNPADLDAAVGAQPRLRSGPTPRESK